MHDEADKLIGAGFQKNDPNGKDAQHWNTDDQASYWRDGADNLLSADYQTHYEHDSAHKLQYWMEKKDHDEFQWSDHLINPGESANIGGYVNPCVS